MNPNNRIIEFYQSNGIIEILDNLITDNVEIVENPENNQINEPVVLNLGPPPVLQRNNPPVYFGEDAGELLADAPFQEFQGYDTPNDFVMPTPCSRCYWVQCNGTCEVDTPYIQAICAQQLAFEEEMDLPPPPRLTRNINTPLLDEEWRDMPSIPPPLARGYTNAYLLDDADDTDEFDMPEGVQYICLTINEDKDEDEDQEDKDQDR